MTSDADAAATWVGYWQAQIDEFEAADARVRVRAIGNTIIEVSNPDAEGYDVPMRLWRLYLIAHQSLLLAADNLRLAIKEQGGQVT